MRASKFTDAQKVFIIRQGEDGTPVKEICRKAGISQATYFKVAVPAIYSSYCWTLNRCRGEDHGAARIDRKR